MKVITCKRYYCPHCGHDQLNKKGFTPDGRQRYRCLACKKTSTYSVRKMGSPAFDPKKLLPIMVKNPLTFTKWELYSLGLLIADGSWSKTNQLSITLEPNDGYILDYVRDALHIKNQVRDAKCGKKGKYYKRLTWGYKHAGPYWEKLGLINSKTGNEVWIDYMANWHFIRGFLDGDGHVSDKRIGFTCSNLDYTQKLQAFIFPYINNLGSISHSRGAYNLQYYGSHAVLLGDLIYKDSDNLRLERKYKKYLEIKNE